MHWKEVAPDKTAASRVAVVGEGSDYELLPRAFAAGLESMGVTAEVLPLVVSPTEFPECISHLARCEVKAVSVCNPLKAEAAKLAKEYFMVRHGLGVANALTLSGDAVYAQNTEVSAFAGKVADLPAGTALVLGSGRAARSAVQGLCEQGWKVRIWNRNVARSKPFVTLFEYYGKVEPIPNADPAGCTLIVNATPIGTKAGENPPVLWRNAKPHSTAIDFVYRNIPTEFLRSAAQRGFRTVDGRELLVDQAATALEWWFGGSPSRSEMLAGIGFRRAG